MFRHEQKSPKKEGEGSDDTQTTNMSLKEERREMRTDDNKITKNSLTSKSHLSTAIRVFRAIDDDDMDIATSLLPELSQHLTCTHVDGETFLTHACRLPASNAMIKALVRAGCDPNQPNARGMTPLCVAASSGHASALKVLLSESVADLSTPSSEGLLPAHIATLRYNQTRRKSFLMCTRVIDSRGDDCDDDDELAGNLEQDPFDEEGRSEERVFEEREREVAEDNQVYPPDHDDDDDDDFNQDEREDLEPSFADEEENEREEESVYDCDDRSYEMKHSRHRRTNPVGSAAPALVADAILKSKRPHSHSFDDNDEPCFRRRRLEHMPNNPSSHTKPLQSMSTTDHSVSASRRRKSVFILPDEVLLDRDIDL